MTTDTSNIAPYRSERTGELLRCEGLCVGYGRTRLLPPLDLSVAAGELVLVIGRNGSGKSTWLKTVLGLIPPLAGKVRFPSPKPRLSYIAQHLEMDDIVPVRGRTLVDWACLRGWHFLNPLHRVQKGPRDRAIEDADAHAFAHQPYRELSGGQRQRVLFARILAGEAEIAFLDEPTAAMDMTSEREAYKQLSALAKERNVAVVVVTHTLSVAASLADRVVFFDPGERGEGGVALIGEPAEVIANPMFRRYLGETGVSDVAAAAG